MPEGLKKIQELIKNENQTVVVLDANGEPAYVLVGFEQYRRLSRGAGDLTSLSEEELLDKVNSEIALWKAANQDKDFEDWTEIAIKNQEKTEPKKPENTLNEAKNKVDEAKTAQDFFFEPLD